MPSSPEPSDTSTCESPGTVTGSPDGSVEASGVIITTTAATIAQITELMGGYVGVCIEVAPTTGYGAVMLDIA